MHSYSLGRTPPDRRAARLVALHAATQPQPLVPPPRLADGPADAHLSPVAAGRTGALEPPTAERAPRSPAAAPSPVPLLVPALVIEVPAVSSRNMLPDVLPAVLPSRAPHRASAHAAPQAFVPPFADVPLTAADVGSALAAAERRLAPRGARLAVVVERVDLLPPRPGLAGRDVPPRCSGRTVYPARVRYEVHRAAEGGGPDEAVVSEATYRFWRDDMGRWSFTGRLVAGTSGGHRVR